MRKFFAVLVFAVLATSLSFAQGNSGGNSNSGGNGHGNSGGNGNGNSGGNGNGNSGGNSNPCPQGGGGAGTIGCEGLPGIGTGDIIVEICYEDIEVTLQTSSLDLEFLMYPGQTFYGQQLAFLATGSPGIGINHTAGVWTGTVPNNTPGITIQNSNWTTTANAFDMAGEADYVLTYDIKANIGSTNASLYNLGFSYVVSYN